LEDIDERWKGYSWHLILGIFDTMF